MGIMKSREEIRKLAEKKLSEIQDSLKYIDFEDHSLPKRFKPSNEEKYQYFLDTLHYSGPQNMVLLGKSPSRDIKNDVLRSVSEKNFVFLSLDANIFLNYSVLGKYLSSLNNLESYIIYVNNKKNEDITIYDLYDLRHIFKERRFIGSFSLVDEESQRNGTPPKGFLQLETKIVIDLTDAGKNIPINLNNNSFCDNVCWYDF